MRPTGHRHEGCHNDPVTEPAVDGRRARGERSREAVLDAVIALYRDGQPDAPVEVIAARAGVSRRSVFRHFADLDAMKAAAVELHMRRIAPLLAAPPTEGDLAARAAALAEQRGRFFEEVTPSRIVTERLRGQVPLIDEYLLLGREMFRQQLGDLFAEELDPLDAAERGELLDALAVAASWDGWHLLRTAEGADVARAGRVVTRTIVALLSCR